jgi:hypothetical protein
MSLMAITELRGCEIVSVGLQQSGGFVLNLAGSDLTAEIRIERTFTLQDEDGVSRHEPADRRTLGRALDLPGRRVTSARYSAHGDLEVRLDRQLVLRASSDPDFENWHVGVPGGMLSSRPGVDEPPAMWRGPWRSRRST